MLQQTQVERVVGYYTRFLEKYPTIESLAETNYEELKLKDPKKYAALLRISVASRKACTPLFSAM